MHRAEGHRQILPGHCRRVCRVGVGHDAQLPCFRFSSLHGFRPEDVQQAPLPDAQTERQGGRAGAPPQIQRVDRVPQSRFQLPQQSFVLAFQPCQKNGVLQIVAVGHIGGVPAFGGVKIHQQAALLIRPHGKAQAVQPGKALRVVPAQPQRRRQQADHAALGGFPVGLAGLKLGVRTPGLQGCSQPKQ